MALKDYYRCKQCDAKIAYGPNRPEGDLEPYLLCASCIERLEIHNQQLSTEVDRLQGQINSIAIELGRKKIVSHRHSHGRCIFKALYQLEADAGKA